MEFKRIDLTFLFRLHGMGVEQAMTYLTDVLKASDAFTAELIEKAALDSMPEDLNTDGWNIRNLTVSRISVPREPCCGPVEVYVDFQISGIQRADNPQPGTRLEGPAVILMWSETRIDLDDIEVLNDAVEDPDGLGDSDESPGLGFWEQRAFYKDE